MLLTHRKCGKPKESLRSIGTSSRYGHFQVLRRFSVATSRKRTVLYPLVPFLIVRPSVVNTLPNVIPLITLFLLFLDCFSPDRLARKRDSGFFPFLPLFSFYYGQRFSHRHPAYNLSRSRCFFLGRRSSIHSGWPRDTSLCSRNLPRNFQRLKSFLDQIVTPL